MQTFKLLLTVLLVTVLSGCVDRMPNEDIVKERKYCLDNGYVPVIHRALWDGSPLYVECKPTPVKPKPVKPKPVECIK